VIELRFGFGDEDERTIQEVAEYLEIPLASAQTAQREAITQLRDVL